MSTLLIRNGEIPTEFFVRQREEGLQDTACIHTPFPGFTSADLLLQGQYIINMAAPNTLWGEHVLEASGCVVLPGFVDVHVHGAAGADTMDSDAEGLAAMACFFARHGVTGFLPTTMTAPYSDIRNAVATVAGADSATPGGARILGMHLEGPYISHKFPGAQPAAFIRPPSLDEFHTLLTTGPVRMVTLAPEAPGAEALVHAARLHNVVVVLGHTDATYDQCVTAVRWGVSQATHTYNAMRGLHHRHPGALGAVLSLDALDAQLIADNIHVHPAAMKILAHCKSAARTLLITDAMRATGMLPGQYDLGGQMVTVAGGQCLLPDGVLAGSLLTMESALANFMAASGLSLAEAWPASSRTPARTLGLDGEIGAIIPGHRADLVVLDKQLNVEATLVGGELVYLRDSVRLIS